ncbi:AAA family ATPase [Rhodopila sp.]|uniref:AAA family ATPase n=1 Tax=Rhodopila sp. TaxID=2480087 RepID=UPI003D09D9DD
MRLAHFRLERYGPFEQLDLPLDPTPGRVNLIVAPNGYGKSIIRQAIGEFLFGIEPRTAMSFRFGTERMRLLADVVDDGRAVSLVRRKGNGTTLARSDGDEVSAGEARRLLGGADETVFRELFGLDTALLRSGGRELIRSQGRLGQVLFAAGGGMARVRELLAELERKRDELGKATARHRSRPLWSALSLWEQGNSDLRRSALRPDGWQTLERQATETAHQLQALLREQAENAAERERLRAIGACRPWLGRTHSAHLVLADTQDVPDLDDGFEWRWREALQQGVVTAGGAEAARLDLQTAREARAALHFDPAWIAADTDITALGGLRGVATQCEIDLPTVQRELAAGQARATAMRRDLGWNAGVPLPPVPVIKDAQRRLRQHPKLAADAAAAAEALTAAERAQAASLGELGGLPDQGDVAALGDLVGLLRAGGDPGIRLDGGRRKLRDAEAALRTSLAAIPDCALPEAALNATAAPSDAKLEAAGKALNQAEAAQAQALRDHAARVADIETEQARLAALERTAMLPAPDALAIARAERDALWALLCGPERPDAAAAVALDRAMRHADGVADALIAHGREVAEATALRGHLAALEIERGKQADALTRTAAALAAARGTLLAIARAAGGDTEDMSGLRKFLRAREAAVACRCTRDTAARELADLENVLNTLGQRLAIAIDAEPASVAELGAVLARADRLIEADRDLAARRRSLIEQTNKHRAARAASAIAAEKAARALTDWEAAWRGVAAELARPDGEAPATTGDAMAQIEELRQAEVTIAEKQGRIDGMGAAVDLLAVKVAGLAGLSAELAALAPIEAATAFHHRLQAEHREAARCKDAERRIEQSEAKLAVAVADAAAAAVMLDGLRAALLVATDAEAEHRLQRIRAVAAARADGAEASRQLALQGGGQTVETLAARAGETTAEADVDRIAAIDAADQERAARIETAREAAATAAAALDRAGNGLDAAEAAHRREAAQAHLARTADEALLLHTTHALLQAALERQASSADQPLLARIGEVFHAITGGAQAGVRVEDSRDGQIMVALETDRVTRKSLDQLSEGTSDQLYLALRIAALEDYAKGTSPLPFVADDILQTFDDPRTTATLRALTALSEQVQVIVLTHHPHVGVLAAGLGDGVRVISLQGAAAALGLSA